MLETYEALGFKILKEESKEYLGDCPLCSKSGKFFLNKSTFLFSCKYCGKQGALKDFLEYYVENCKENYPVTSARLKSLAKERGISSKTLQKYGIFFDGSCWGFPIRAQSGSIVSLQKYYYAEESLRPKNLKGTPLSLIHLETLTPKHDTVLICEGRWDAMKLYETVYNSEVTSVDLDNTAILASPSATAWKTEWSKFLSGRDVYLLYDNDKAGREGIEKVSAKLVESARNLYGISWESLEGLDGDDLRDYLSRGGDVSKVLETSVPLKTAGPVGSRATSKQDEEEVVYSNEPRPRFEEVVKRYRKWLYLPQESIDTLKVIYATVMSNRIGGDPLWVYVVGPPGSGKTELLMSLSGCSDIAIASSLTPHSLVSGYQNFGGKDPSLLPKLFGKVFVLKDFTEVLQMPRTAKDEVYAILRGAYDGEVKKTFGNGVVRWYQGTFGMICGVTNAIDAENTSSLGERFLKWRVGRSLEEGADERLVLQALSHVGNEEEMKRDLSSAAFSFLSVPLDRILTEDADLSRTSNGSWELPRKWLIKIVSLSEVVAYLRTSVERDSRGEKLLYRPQPEVSTRIAKQLKRLLIGLSMCNTPVSVTDKDFELVCKCALDTCHGFGLEIVDTIYRATSSNNFGGCESKYLSVKTGIPLSTLRDWLENLHMVGILEEMKEGLAADVRKFRTWKLSNWFQKHWKVAVEGEDLDS